MSDVTKILPENERYQICRKRKAEFLCDMPVGRMRTLHFKNDDVTTDYENSFKWLTNTCDKSICSKCATEIAGDIHFCKKCIEKLKRVIG